MSPNAQEYIYRRHRTTSSSTGSNTHAPLPSSVPFQQSWSTSPALADGHALYSAETLQLGALATALASTSLDQRLGRPNPPYARPASGPSQNSYGSSTSQTGSVPGIAPTQAAALPARARGPIRNTSGGQFEQLDPRKEPRPVHSPSR